MLRLALNFLILFTVSSFLQVGVLFAQTTAQFSTSPTLISHPSVPSWKTSAEVTIGGVVYELTNGGNGGWAFSGSGGVSNSSCLWYSTAATTSVTIKRKDGQRFQFHGVWLKYTNINHSAYTPPFLTVNYVGSGASSETYARNQTLNLSKNVNVTSVTLMFSGLLDLYFDNLIVGPALASAATVTTSAPSNVAGTMATLGGNVTSDGGGTITERGVVYSTSANPTTSDNKSMMGTGAGAFSGQVTGLALSTIYYARAYAINSAATSYGTEVSFTTTDGSGPVVINPTMDSAIDDMGSYPTDNTLYIGDDLDYGYGYPQAFFKFVVPHDLTGTITDAKLKIYINYYDGGTAATVRAFGSNDDSWAENTNSVPSKDVTLGQTTVNSIGWLELDVTSFVINEFNGDKTVSLVVNTNTLGSTFFAGINSRESSTNKPELVLTMATGPALPTVATTEATSVLAEAALLNGNVSDDGGATVTSRGFVYSTTDNTPTIGEGEVTNVTVGSGTGVFQESLAGLSPSTTYYFQAYASNSEGTSYGGVQSFTTGIAPRNALFFDGFDDKVTTNISLTSDNLTNMTMEAWFKPARLDHSDYQGILGDDHGGFNSRQVWIKTNNKIAISASGTEWTIDYTVETGVWYHIAVTYSPSQIKAYINGHAFTNNVAGTNTSIGKLAIGVGWQQGQPFEGIIDDVRIWNNIRTESEINANKNNELEGTESNLIHAFNFNQGDPGGDNSGLTTLVNQASSSDGTLENFGLSGSSSNWVGSQDRLGVTATLSTTAITEFDHESATMGGNVIYDGGPDVTERGVVYATSSSPTISDTKVQIGTGTGTFSQSVSGLTAETEYFVRAYATNSEGTSYGGVESFTTEAEPSNPPTITTTPTTTVPYGQPYNYSAIATKEGDLETTLTATTLPAWLTFNTAGQSTATRFGNVPSGVGLSGVAGDEDGNIYAIRQNGTEIFKIQPDGTTASWKSGMKSGFIVALHIADGYIYIPRYGDRTHSITRIPLNNPSSEEEIFIEGYSGIAALTDKDGIMYATEIDRSEILKINKSTRDVEVILTSTDGIPYHGPYGLTFDKLGNLYIATWNHRSILKYDGTTLSTALSGLPNSVSSIRVDKNSNFYLSMQNGGVRKYTSDFSSFQGVSLAETDNIWSLSFTSSGALVYANFTTNEVYGLQTGAVLMGTPAKSDLGEHPVVVRAQNDNGSTDQAFTIIVTDETAPVVSDLSPTDNATDVAQQPTLTITFDEEVVLGSTGTFTVNNGGTVLKTYDLSVNEDRNAFVLSADKMTLSVDLDSTLPVNTGVTIGISSGFVADMAENAFAGFDASSNTWRFTTINKQEQTITFPEIADKTYGDDTFTLGDAETDKGLTVTYTAADPTVVSITGNQATILKAGMTIITGSQEGDDMHFEAASAERTLEVKQAILKITAEDKSKVYGEENPALTFTYSGLVNGDTKAATEPSISTTATATSNVGNYPITLEGAADANYDITLVAGELEVTHASLTITAEDKSKVYGSENPALTFTYSGLVNGDTQTATAPGISTTGNANSNVGTYPITLTGAADANYNITLVAGEMEVTQASLTITAEDKSKVYGSENPALTFTYSGLVNGDTKAATAPGISTTGTANSNVGPYPITLAGAVDANYNITLVAGELEVTQASLTITAEDKSKVYGSENPALTFTYSGLVNGDTKAATAPGISTTGTANSNVGTYPITLTGAADANYDITLVAGELEVTQAPLTITAEDKFKVYGSENPALTFTYSGLVNGDTQTATVPGISTTGTASSNVGNYPITLEGAADGNYDITLVAGELEVTQATLTITAEDKSKVYGEDNPTLTFTYSGLVNGDTQAATEPSISTTATASSSVGTYPITLTGAADANYDITLVESELEVAQASLTITAEDKSKVYGSENPALTFTYSGLVNGDTQTATVSGISTTGTASSNVGTYPITLAGAADANYDITLVEGELEITQASLTITAEDKTKVYGSENPALTFTYSGLVNGDTKAATEPNISTTAIAGSNVGNYPITLEGAADGNYDITLVAGELEVTQAALTIKADDKSKVYGSENPAMTFTYSGFVNGDTKAATEPSISTTATSSSSVGYYPITLIGAADANYNITMVEGELEVTQAILTIIATSNQHKAFGEADPVFTYTSGGFVNNDNSDILTGALDREKGEATGAYVITLGTLSAGANYSINYTPADFTITPSELELVFHPADMQTPWGQVPTMPATVGVMTVDGQVLEFPITWDMGQMNLFARGQYPMTAAINLTEGYVNPNNLKVNVVMSVLPKPAPTDIKIDNTAFRADSKNNEIWVGQLTVEDAVDNIHTLELVQGTHHSEFFTISNGTLYWNSADRAEGRTSFRVHVKVTDRDGNIIEKVFTIERQRESVKEIEIFNSFTPDGDRINDTWGVSELRFYSGVIIQIFERSGKRLFYTQNPDIRWDGSFENRDMATGTYYWTVEVKETGEVRKGMLNLIRK